MSKVCLQSAYPWYDLSSVCVDRSISQQSWRITEDSRTKFSQVEPPLKKVKVLKSLHFDSVISISYLIKILHLTICNSWKQLLSTQNSINCILTYDDYGGNDNDDDNDNQDIGWLRWQWWQWRWGDDMVTMTMMTIRRWEMMTMMTMAMRS